MYTISQAQKSISKPQLAHSTLLRGENNFKCDLPVASLKLEETSYPSSFVQASSMQNLYHYSSPILTSHILYLLIQPFNIQT